MINRDDLRYEIDRLREQIAGMERHQRRANSRIRQDIYAVLTLLSVSVGIAVMIYNEWPSWSYFVLVGIGGPALQAWLSRSAQDQEEPK